MTEAMHIDREVSKTLNCMHEAGRVMILAVDFYNGAVADTNQALSSAASDKNHTGGVLIEWKR